MARARPTSRSRRRRSPRSTRPSTKRARNLGLGLRGRPLGRPRFFRFLRRKAEASPDRGIPRAHGDRRMPATRYAAPSWGRVGVYEARTSYPHVPQVDGDEFGWSHPIEIPAKTLLI